MIRRWLVLILMLSCSRSRPPSSDAGLVAVVVEASSSPAADGAPDAKPRAVERTGTVWPYHAWDRGEALTFNQFEARPGVGLYAYDADGWSKHVVDRKPLTVPLAKHALDLVTSTEGDVEVSKCPFPRHAVVLYAGDEPVASINVCFQCGDILLWPPWPGPEFGAPGWEARNKRQLAFHEKTFPKWKTFFRDDVGFSIE